MNMKGGAHKTLSPLFKSEYIPPEMTMNGSKERTQSDFKKKKQGEDCHQKQIETHLPWENTAKGAICEFNEGASRKIIQTGSSRRVWDHYLKLTDHICPCTVQDLYMLDGKTLEAVMKGETANIS